ncbi:Glucose/ribitol dehydrogenase [Penicillium bovifimosum]|uniref:Glucose/ribitol dehydrogenase n=1 Tax=Penicillium bovifimosum TaxID=126998 RepID=A0A9W9GT22_9EURO|nr:Glucose/ribitol dehydrogenase [Penicillium bovifimosum]KAJ5129338.1 Glucose/ribitol dehydrogenase [Penicillium bovifimosum]
MTFPYNHVLLIGATSGIGRAIADRLIQAEIKVTAVGRRKDRLDEFVGKHGKEKANSMVYDVSVIDRIPRFAADATAQHPDIDCVFLNHGTQRKYKLTNPKDGDLVDFRAEMDVNFTSYVALTQAFTPFLLSKSGSASFILSVHNLGVNRFIEILIFFDSTTSLLALVPAPRIPAYSAAKAALNAFIYCLRDQLRESNVGVIELAPPLVSTELHDYMGIEKGRSMGMPAEQYAEYAIQALQRGSDEVLGGSVQPIDNFQELVDKRRKLFNEFAPMLRDVE